MAVGSVNVGGGGGRLNIYTQLSEPSKKEGLWIETATRHKTVMVDDKFYFDNAWIDRSLGLYPDLPYNFSHGSVAKVGTNIYLMGSQGSKNFYKYDTISKTYTKLADLPYDFYQGVAVAVGNDIYFFGGLANTNNLSHAYKYDTVNAVFTKLTNVPFPPVYSSAATIGTNIYLFGGNTGTDASKKTAYKYDTANGTYTRLTDIPVAHSDSVAVAVGTDVYLISDATSYSYTHKYDTISNTYTRLADHPNRVTMGWGVAVGTDIYVFQMEYVYKYDISNNTYTRLVDVPISFYNGVADVVEDKIYLFGNHEYQYQKVIQVFSLTSKQYADETLVLFRNSPSSGAYYTEFVTPHLKLQGVKDTRITTGFNNAWLFTNGKLQELPSYYGNGSQWVKFKN